MLFYENIEETIRRYPVNMADFYTIISYREYTENKDFYQSVIEQLTKLLLKLNKPNRTNTQVKQMEVLITNISELTDSN